MTVRCMGGRHLLTWAHEAACLASVRLAYGGWDRRINGSIGRPANSNDSQRGASRAAAGAARNARGRMATPGLFRHRPPPYPPSSATSMTTFPGAVRAR